METTQTINGITVNKIESPLSAFNNILVEISKKIENIYFPKTKQKQQSILNNLSYPFMNELIFENEKITVFNKIRIIKDGSEIKFRFCGEFNQNQLKMVELTLKHSTELKMIFHQYLYMVTLMSNKRIDDTVTEHFLNSIQSELVALPLNTTIQYLIPYKNKIKYLYDKDNTLLDNLYNRYSYIIRFIRKSNQSINYKLVRVLSSELNEAKSINNLRYEDVEILYKAILPYEHINKFLSELYYYGEIYKTN